MSGGFNPGRYGVPGESIPRLTNPSGLGGSVPIPEADDIVYGGHEGTDVEAALDARPPTHVLASSDPAATDDTGDGHVVGCRWINESSGEEFVAVDVSTGAAVWESTTAGGGSLIVADDDASVTVNPTTTLQFEADDFAVSDEGSGVAKVTFVGTAAGSLTVSDDHGHSVNNVTEIFFGQLYVTDLGGGVVSVDNYQPLIYPTTISWVSDGFNGLFNLLGENAGGGTFVNPHGTYYTATQSTNQDGTRTADKGTDHLNDANNNCTHTQSGADQWWKADFGAGQNVTPTRLGILGRSGGGNHPGAFKLQGSNDNSAWTDLLTVTTPGITDNVWVSWAVVGSAAYRYLRIFQTVSNYLVLGDVEIWGTIDD